MHHQDYPTIRSHFVPRTRQGRGAVIAFAILFALAEPPLLWSLANRIEPFVLGLPFLYVYLLFVYCSQIGVLFWMHGQDV